jgi:uncharacterized oligopeptide transporter (OPT) family protein
MGSGGGGGGGAPDLASVLSTPLLAKRLRATSAAGGDGGAELTFRGVAAGCAIGGIVCLSNIYFGLKTSLTLGSSFTGAILGFASLSWAPGFSRRENCTLTSACNAGGGFAAVSARARVDPRSMLL